MNFFYKILPKRYLLNDEDTISGKKFLLVKGTISKLNSRTYLHPTKYYKVVNKTFDLTYSKDGHVYVIQVLLSKKYSDIVTQYHKLGRPIKLFGHCPNKVLRYPEVVVLEGQFYTAIYSSKELLKHKDDLSNISRYDFNTCYDIKPLPTTIKKKYGVLDIQEALMCIHKPQGSTAESVRNNCLHAIDSLAFHYVLANLAKYQLCLTKHTQSSKSFPMKFSEDSMNRFLQACPHTLTSGQKTAISHMKTHIEKHESLFLLIQGDVGSGKTMVLFAYTLQLLDNNLSVLLLVPTVLLAYQHYFNFKKLFKDRYRCVILRSGAAVTDEITEPCLIVSTHLVLHRPQLTKVGLIIIDEQQKFGVEQRNTLVDKYSTPSYRPHVIIMTATPIPRTLVQSLSLSLSVSYISDKPLGRLDIKTFCIKEPDHKRFFTFIKKVIASGQKVIWVVPTIKILLSKLSFIRSLSDVVVTLYGTMNDAQKIEALEHFKMRKGGVLLSTSIIETGLDCPDVNVIVIDHPTFGLSHLHQMRGRIGRRTEQGYCYLLVSTELQERSASLLVKYSGGYDIAICDLVRRGSGSLLGKNQSGHNKNKVLQLARLDNVINVLTSMSATDFNDLVTM